MRGIVKNLHYGLKLFQLVWVYADEAETFLSYPAIHVAVARPCIEIPVDHPAARSAEI